MDITPLPNKGDVSPEEFRRLFEASLGGLFPRAMAVLNTLGPMHSHSIANVIHMAQQKGIVDQIIQDLERWCEVFPKAPNLVVAHADTRQFFDVLYGQHFMTAGDTVAGLGPFEVTHHAGGVRTFAVKPGTRLWLPGDPR